jgi:hypothetical protein
MQRPIRGRKPPLGAHRLIAHDDPGGRFDQALRMRGLFAAGTRTA